MHKINYVKFQKCLSFFKLNYTVCSGSSCSRSRDRRALADAVPDSRPGTTPRACGRFADRARRHRAADSAETAAGTDCGRRECAVR